jgi:hypothetical protein
MQESALPQAFRRFRNQDYGVYLAQAVSFQLSAISLRWDSIFGTEDDPAAGITRKVAACDWLKCAPALLQKLNADS